MCKEWDCCVGVADEICAEMQHLRLGDTILTEIHKRFKENKVEEWSRHYNKALFVLVVY